MAVNSTHPDYDASLPEWLRSRDVLAGEDEVKSAGEKYLPRLQSQTDEEYHAYRARAAFFNASTRTAEGYVGLICRLPPFIKVPVIKKALLADVLTEIQHAQLLATRIKTIGGLVPGSFDLPRSQKFLQPPKDTTDIVAVIQRRHRSRGRGHRPIQQNHQGHRGRGLRDAGHGHRDSRRRGRPPPRIHRVPQGIRETLTSAGEGLQNLLANGSM
jgi:hypothetical protein